MMSRNRGNLMCGGFLLLTALFAGSAQAAPAAALAEEQLEPSQLLLEPLFEFERAALTVAGPAGYSVERAFGPGEALRFALSDGDGRSLPDGRYSYSLRLSPGPAHSRDIQEGLFFIDEGAGVSRTERRHQLASIRETLNREQQRRLQARQQAAAITPDQEEGVVSPPSSYALSIDGDFALGGYVFKEGRPFLHNDGGSTYGNTALGLDALISTISGSPYVWSGTGNTAVGQGALQNNSSGFGNTASGVQALYYNTTGYGNTASGPLALSYNTTGRWNTASGALALLYNTTGDDNTASGANTLRYNTTGFDNTASGSDVLYLNTTGFKNTASGADALYSNTTGYGNTANGNDALADNTTGSRNVALGYRAGFYATTGDDNLFIANEGVAGESDTIRIGTQGTQNQTFIAGIYPTVLSQAAGYVVTDANGQLGFQAFVSSRRFKEGIGDIGEASDPVMKLRPATFRFKNELPGGEPGVQFGLIAEEVAEVFPELVTWDGEGHAYAVKYRFLPVLLLNELQKQARLNREQQSEIERLRSVERELVAIKARLADLEAAQEPTVRVAAGRPSPASQATSNGDSGWR